MTTAPSLPFATVYLSEANPRYGTHLAYADHDRIPAHRLTFCGTMIWRMTEVAAPARPMCPECEATRVALQAAYAPRVVAGDVERLRAALAVYADRVNWSSTGWRWVGDCDRAGWLVATEALAPAVAREGEAT